ncbi:MAG: hypothetical protein HZA50_16200 [Planctomycetes bacterium]|nr:hypothetical protein [Planctomycetota bacterium]
MKRICAWCRQELEPVGHDDNSHDYITHGICRSCYNILLLQLGVDVHKYLDSIAAPIVLIDAEGTVRAANASAMKLLNKKPADIEGYTGGEIFECPYSKLPGGCGKTTHCAGCTIRNTLLDTYATGKGFLKRPVILNQNTPEDPQKINMFISTEKVGNIVFMRIDEMEGRSTPAKKA